MPHTATDDAHDALKAALTEALRENREWLRDLVQEALVEIAEAEARHEAEVRGTGVVDPAFPVPHGQA
ncbi:MAG: hypothetical protein AAGK21_13015 [Bacteroidota bacterium]